MVSVEELVGRNPLQFMLVRCGDDFPEFASVEGRIERLALAARHEVLNGLAESLTDDEAAAEFLANLAVYRFDRRFEGLHAASRQQRSMGPANGGDQSFGVGYHGVSARSGGLWQRFAADSEYMKGLIHKFRMRPNARFRNPINGKLHTSWRARVDDC